MTSKQGKTLSRGMVVLVMMIMILVEANVSIAAQEEKMNGTYFGGLIGSDDEFEFEFESEFPDAISSHFRRVLAQVQSLTGSTSNPNKAAINAQNTAYRGSSPLSSSGGNGCASEYNRRC